MPAVTDGVYCVDKPFGITSHDVVSRLRRLLKRRDIGHAGTLDPMATGVMVVLVGEATKLSAYLTADDKAYRTRVILGSSTASLDADSPRSELLPLDSARLAEFSSPFGQQSTPHLYAAFVAESARATQIPPAISAIHIDGVRAYERVRKGEDVAMPSREVSVRSLSYLAHGIDGDDAWIEAELHVGKGYYVRSFARDIAEHLQTVGHLNALRRIRSGVFDVKDAHRLDAPLDELLAARISVEAAAARCMPTLQMSEELTTRLRQGKRVANTPPTAAPYAAALDAAGQLIAVVGPTEGGDELKVLRGFISQH